MIQPGQLLRIPQKKCDSTQLFEVVSVAYQLEVRYVGGTANGRTTSFSIQPEKAESYKVDRCGECGQGVMHPERTAKVEVSE
jgi:hypothetical protein